MERHSIEPQTIKLPSTQNKDGLPQIWPALALLSVAISRSLAGGISSPPPPYLLFILSGILAFWIFLNLRAHLILKRLSGSAYPVTVRKALILTIVAGPLTPWMLWLLISLALMGLGALEETILEIFPSALPLSASAILVLEKSRLVITLAASVAITFCWYIQIASQIARCQRCPSGLARLKAIAAGTAIAAGLVFPSCLAVSAIAEPLASSTGALHGDWLSDYMLNFQLGFLLSLCGFIPLRRNLSAALAKQSAI